MSENICSLSCLDNTSNSITLCKTRIDLINEELAQLNFWLNCEDWFERDENEKNTLKWRIEELLVRTKIVSTAAETEYEIFEALTWITEVKGDFQENQFNNIVEVTNLSIDEIRKNFLSLIDQALVWGVIGKPSNNQNFPIGAIA